MDRKISYWLTMAVLLVCPALVSGRVNRSAGVTKSCECEPTPAHPRAVLVGPGSIGEDGVAIFTAPGARGIAFAWIVFPEQLRQRFVCQTMEAEDGHGEPRGILSVGDYRGAVHLALVAIGRQEIAIADLTLVIQGPNVIPRALRCGHRLAAAAGLDADYRQAQPPLGFAPQWRGAFVPEAAVAETQRGHNPSLSLRR